MSLCLMYLRKIIKVYMRLLFSFGTKIPLKLDLLQKQQLYVNYCSKTTTYPPKTPPPPKKNGKLTFLKNYILFSKYNVTNRHQKGKKIKM